MLPIVIIALLLSVVILLVLLLAAAIEGDKEPQRIFIVGIVLQLFIIVALGLILAYAKF